ncbi:MAG: haloacid dehalogenase-like hydrolase [Chlamydiia bacterium]|nr:haloacid dehalogenase-like hydrolase [Chlamydiia bacterium]
MRVFDLDHTLITSNISLDFGLHLYRRKVISLNHLLTLFFWYARHKVLGLGIEELQQAVFNRLFKGVLLQTILDEVELFLKENPLKLYIPAISFLESDSILLSSSPDFLVGPVCKALNINSFKASTYNVDASGQLDSIQEVIEGAQKAKEIQLLSDKMGLRKEEITFYTDSIWDAPAFERVGTIVAVRPDRKLKKLAEKNHWEILGER